MRNFLIVVIFSAVVVGLSSLFAGCKGTTPTPNPTPLSTPIPVDPAVQAGINAGVTALTTFGCTFIPPQDKPAAGVALATIVNIASISPAEAYQKLIDLANTPGISFLWSGLHGVLDLIAKISSQQWVQYAQGAILSAAKGCEAGIGVGTGA